jgi:ribosomal protein L34E
MVYRPQLALIDAHVSGACWCVGVPFVSPRPVARVDSVGKPACEICGRRLADVKHHRPHRPGRACAPRCKPSKHALEPVEEQRPHSTERPAKKQRRTKSDPGQPLPIASTRLRIRAPKPPPPAPKPRPVRPFIDPIALLDAAHAHRMALMEAESTVGLSFGADS